MRKKFLVTLCTVLCLASTTSVFAKNYTAPTDNAEVPIDFTMESLFTVTLPENIQGKAVKEVNFNYSVEGNIASNEEITVKPVSNTFKLADITNKAIDANVSIPKTNFNFSEIVTKNEQTGTISLDNLPAGKWSGICKFSINLRVVKPAGLYDAEGNLLAPLTIEDVEKSYSQSNMLPLEMGITDFNSVAEAVIPEGTTYIGQYLFYFCEGLKTVNIPDSVRYIGERAFQGCTSLESPIVIPEGVVEIEDNTFCNCHNIPSIKLPTSLKKIEFGAFGGCTGVSSITVPDTVATIGMYAFLDVPHVYYHGPISLSQTGAVAVN